MPLPVADTLEETSATQPKTAPVAMKAMNRPPALVLDDSRPLALNRDSIQLLLQSPNKLFLYWSFAANPHTTLREAFGELAAHYRLAVRLVKVDSGEEFLLDAAKERLQWFEVYARHVYRADVGFHAAGRPFICLLSSNVVCTPPDSASQLSDEEPEFQLEAEEFVRLLSDAGYQRYTHGLTGEAGDNANHQIGEAVATTVAPQSESVPALREEANEYPHR